LKFAVSPRSLDPINLVTYYLTWVKTSWTESIYNIILPLRIFCQKVCHVWSNEISLPVTGHVTVCPSGLDSFYTVTYCVSKKSCPFLYSE